MSLSEISNRVIQGSKTRGPMRTPKYLLATCRAASPFNTGQRRTPSTPLGHGRTTAVPPSHSRAAVGRRLALSKAPHCFFTWESQVLHTQVFAPCIIHYGIPGSEIHPRQVRFPSWRSLNYVSTVARIAKNERCCHATRKFAITTPPELAQSRRTARGKHFLWPPSRGITGASLPDSAGGGSRGETSWNITRAPVSMLRPDCIRARQCF